MGWKPDHKRTKPKAGAKPTAEQQRYREWVRAKGCLVCGGPAETHHVTSGIHGGRLSRSHWLLTPLCFGHHSEQGFPDSVHSTSHDEFYRIHGINLLHEAERLRQLYLAIAEDVV